MDITKQVKEMLSKIQKPIDYNTRELLIDAFVKGYASRIKDEKIMLDNRKSFFVKADDRRQGYLQEFNYGATSCRDTNFGKDAGGLFMTYDEASQIPWCELPTQNHISDLFRTSNRVYGKSETSYQGFGYDHRICFEGENGNRCEFYCLIKPQYNELYDDLREQGFSKFVHVWLNDYNGNKKEDKALSMIIGVGEFKGITPYYYEAEVSKPLYKWVPKTYKLNAHFIVKDNISHSSKNFLEVDGTNL